MGVMMAPVEGSGSMPAWMTLVANFMDGKSAKMNVRLAKVGFRPVIWLMAAPDLSKETWL